MLYYWLLLRIYLVYFGYVGMVNNVDRFEYCYNVVELSFFIVRLVLI